MSTNRENDIKDIELALSGKEEGYSRLVSRYEEYLKTYIESRYGPGEDSRDILQETLHKAFRALGTYDSTYSFTTWITNIAKNCIIDHIRREKKNRGTEYIPDSGNGMEMVENMTAGSVSDPESRLISQQEITGLTEAINMLDDNYREIAVMRFLNDCAYEEISVQLDIPLNTVKTRINRARKLLLKTLDKNGRDNL